MYLTVLNLEICTTYWRHLLHFMTWQWIKHGIFSRLQYMHQFSTNSPFPPPVIWVWSNWKWVTYSISGLSWNWFLRIKFQNSSSHNLIFTSCYHTRQGHVEFHLGLWNTGGTTNPFLVEWIGHWKSLILTSICRSFGESFAHYFFLGNKHLLCILGLIFCTDFFEISPTVSFIIFAGSINIDNCHFLYLVFFSFSPAGDFVNIFILSGFGH